MRVLILDNYDSFTYNLVHYVEQFCDEAVVFRNDELDLYTVKNFDKIIISPGPGLPKDSGCLIELIDQYHKTKPILGVCLGLQGIVEYFGGSLFNMETVRHGVQTQINITETSDYLFNEIPSTFKAGLYHSWAAKDLPDSLQATSISESGIIMSISHKEFDVKGVQFHPESILTEYGLKLIENWVKR